MKAWKRRDESGQEYAIYGNTYDIGIYLGNDEEPKSIKEIYLMLLNEKIMRGTSWIPSRSEKKNPEIKWKMAWKNNNSVRQVSPLIKQFAWDCVQDMVVVGQRKHRANQNKNCETLVEDDSGNVEVCGRLESLRHALIYCPASTSKFEWTKKILTNFLGRNIQDDEVIFMSFNHRNKKKLKLGIWFNINCLYYIYCNRPVGIREMSENMKKFMFWHVTLERWIANRDLFYELYALVRDGT